ncbi:MAG: hypothetical protein Q7R47_04860, partial [Candidatus Diapherotrites archaeon]|nr:hypothetical protein [Candidatus Diapherotrites archaeon]
MAQVIHRRARFIPKRKLIVVRSRQTDEAGSTRSVLSTIGRGPWVDVRIEPVPVRQQRHLPRIKAVVK